MLKLRLLGLYKQFSAFWSRLRQPWKVALLAVVSVALLGVVPGYRLLRSWRAQDLADRAVASLEQGDLQRANELAASSLQLEGHSAPIRRLFAEHFEDVDPEAALVHGHVLAGHPKATNSDLKRYVEQCLDRDFAAESVRALNRLLEREPDEASHWVLAGEYERFRGNYQEALSHVDRALAMAPNDPGAHWLGATLATESNSPELQAAGRDRLWKLTERTDFVGLRALSGLAEGKLESKDQVKVLVERLARHPLATEAHQLAGQRIRLLHPDAERQTILRECEERFGVKNRALFLAWLNRVGEHRSVLEALAKEEAQSDRDLLLVYSEALLETGKAKDLAEWLEKPGETFPIRDTTRQFLALEAMRGSGQAGRAERLRASLIRRAEGVNPPVSLISLAKRFEAKALWADAAETYHHLIERYAGERKRAYDRLTHVYRQQGNLSGLLEVSREFHVESPDNPIYAHNLAYLSLLNGDSVGQSLAILEGLANKHRLVSSICVLAMQAAQTGDLLKARKLVEPLVWQDLSSLDQRWVRAIVSEEDGSEALNGLKPLPLTLFPQEEEWLEWSLVASTSEEG